MPEVVQVGAADAPVSDVDDRLVGAGRGSTDVLDPQIVGGVGHHGEIVHHVSSSVRRTP